MKTIIITILLYLFFTPISSEELEFEHCPSEVEYPSWFFNVPPNCVVGYQCSNKSVLDDGLDRVGAYKRMRAKGFVRTYESSTDDISVDSISFYYIKDSTISISPLDTFSLLKGNVELFSEDSAITINSKSDILLCDATQWDENSIKNGYIYGFGLYKFSSYDQLGSWIKAESDGIKEIINHSIKQVITLQRETNSNFDETAKIEYDVELANLSVERRFYREFSGVGYCCVVLSMPIKSLKSIFGSDSSTISSKLISEYRPSKDSSQKSTAIKTDENYDKYRESIKSRLRSELQ